MSVAVTFVQISSTICVTSCILGKENIPDCSLSQDSCCTPNPFSCFNFFTCLGGTLFSAFCPRNEVFQELSLRCQKGNSCYPQCDSICPESYCVENCCIPFPDNCKYFRTCVDKRLIIGQCPAGSNFDRYSLACVPGYDCSDDPPCPKLCRNVSNCEEDCCLPEEGFCGHNFTVCKNKIRTNVTCPEDKRFNIAILACDSCSNDIAVYVEGNRQVLSQEEFLSAIYSVYTNPDKTSQEVN